MKHSEPQSQMKVILLLVALSVILPADAHSQSDFYRGKTIRIVQGRNPGGSGDLRVKALVPFLQR